MEMRTIASYLAVAVLAALVIYGVARN
jgi:hypothetical protein